MNDIRNAPVFLMEASMDGHVEVARLLLDSGAQVNIQHYYIVMNISLFNPL
jgi:hypothetical protein